MGGVWNDSRLVPTSDWISTSCSETWVHSMSKYCSYSHAVRGGGGEGGRVSFGGKKREEERERERRGGIE